METFLTLVIALGGIATGIGAIWAALAARRQGQLSERQAQLTQQSLAQTERSLAEQGKSLHEQNERARLTLEVDLLFRMVDRYDSQHFMSRRRSAAKHAIENFFRDDDIVVEVERFNRATRDVANFFEQLGHLQRLGALQAESVWTIFGIITRAYWTLLGPGIQKMRQESKDPTIYENFERLNRVVADLDRERGIEPLTRGEVRRIVESEAVVGEESSTSAE